MKRGKWVVSGEKPIQNARKSQLDMFEHLRKPCSTCGSPKCRRRGHVPLTRTEWSDGRD